ncbi:serine hydrolase [Streptomyces pathocidini]|uniref:serine hydrolase n=1 Tax=Streptomyces pathocidini TaxID=1650571 RepID=UPI0033DEEBF6
MNEDIPEDTSRNEDGASTPYRALWAAAATALVVSGALVATAYGVAHAGGGSGATAGAPFGNAELTSAAAVPVGEQVSPSPSGSSSPAPAPSPSSTVSGMAVAPEAVDLEAALAPVAAAAGGGLSVALREVESGAGASYGEEAFDTASIAKVNILAALLVQAQHAGRELTDLEKSQAIVMIEKSDNASALALWKTIGRAKGLEAANQRLGVTGTEGGPGDLWGLTQTTADGQLALLEAVFGTIEDSPLTEESRTYLQGLMEHVSADQAWGVSSAASDPAETALKNGWLPRTATGLWDINSIGRIESNGHTYLVAVLSDGNKTKEAGIETVEAAAKAAVAALSEAAD